MTTEQNTTQETDWAEKIGKPAMESIAGMVAALECDYDRLEELRDEREALESELDGENPSDATHALRDWDERNAEELKELSEAAGECESREDAEQRIHDDPLSLEVRSGWVTVGEWGDDTAPEEFCILLSTGGPAVRILGELDEHCEPRRAWLQVQDWGKCWTDYCRPGNGDTLLTYCRCFYFGS